MKHFWSGKTFKWFIVTYIIVLLFPLAVGGVLLARVNRDIEQDIYRLNSVVWERSSTMLTTRPREVKSMAYDLSTNRYAQSLMFRTSFSGEDRLMVYKMIQDFVSLKTKYGMVQDFYIYFPNSDTVITSNSSYPAGYFFAWNFGGEEDGKAWRAALGEHDPFGRIIHMEQTLIPLSGREGQIAYKQTVSTGGQQWGMSMVLLIDKSFLVNELKKVSLTDDNLVCILDAQGDVVALSGPGSGEDLEQVSRLLHPDGQDGAWTAVNVGGRRMVATVRDMGIFEWKCICLIPINSFLSQLSSSYTALRTGLIVIMAVGLLMTVVFAYLCYQPIHKLLRWLLFHKGEQGPQQKKLNEMAYIRTVIAEAMDRDEMLSRVIAVQQTALAESSLQKMLEGRVPVSDGELQALAGNGLGLVYENIWVLIVRPSPSARLDDKAILDIMLHEIRLEIPNVSLVIEAEGPRLYLLVNCGEGLDRAAQERYVGQLMGVLSRQRLGSCFVAVGEPYPLAQMHQSYLSACKALDHSFLYSEATSLFAQDILSSDENYYYPDDVEKRLMRLVRQGDSVKCREQIREVIRVNLQERKLSLKTTVGLLYILLNTAHRLEKEKREWRDGNGNTPARLLATCSNLDEAVTQIIFYFDSLCAEYTQPKKEQGAWRAKKVLEYVDNHFTDYSISLATVSGHFNLTPQYLSHMFKEYTKDNFSNYIHARRVNLAKKLLEDPTLTIDDIAREIGFGNYQALARAFQKYEGVSPGTYRYRFTK